MDQLTAAIESTATIANLTASFMEDAETFAKGAELGFSPLGFYIAGRGGALGDVDADVVTAAFLFLEPTTVREHWNGGREILPPHETARHFAGCLGSWTAAHVPADLDTNRLAELTNRLVAAASPAGAPLFAGWRSNIEVPEGQAAALFALNALRELRNAYHGAAILTSGVTMQQAVSHRTPYMSRIFGWGDPINTADVADRWDRAEEATNRAMAPVFDVLDEAERQEFVELADALREAAG